MYVIFMFIRLVVVPLLFTSFFLLFTFSYSVLLYLITLCSFAFCFFFLFVWSFILPSLPRIYICSHWAIDNIPTDKISLPKMNTIVEKHSQYITVS